LVSNRVPRLNCTFGEFVEIISAHGFVLHRQGATSHRRYRAEINGVVYYVDVAGSGNERIKPGTLKSMIRQSGLPAHLFRK
jgi:predicted RNA binding protein YcfA (HicA-like mRNA interferase family)